MGDNELEEKIGDLNSLNEIELSFKEFNNLIIDKYFANLDNYIHIRKPKEMNIRETKKYSRLAGIVSLHEEDYAIRDIIVCQQYLDKGIDHIERMTGGSEERYLLIKPALDKLKKVSSFLEKEIFRLIDKSDKKIKSKGDKNGRQ